MDRLLRMAFICGVVDVAHGYHLHASRPRTSMTRANLQGMAALRVSTRWSSHHGRATVVLAANEEPEEAEPSPVAVAPSSDPGVDSKRSWFGFECVCMRRACVCGEHERT